MIPHTFSDPAFVGHIGDHGLNPYGGWRYAAHADNISGTPYQDVSIPRTKPFIVYVMLRSATNSDLRIKLNNQSTANYHVQKSTNFRNYASQNAQSHISLGPAGTYHFGKYYFWHNAYSGLVSGIKLFMSGRTITRISATNVEHTDVNAIFARRSYWDGISNFRIETNAPNFTGGKVIVVDHDETADPAGTGGAFGRVISQELTSRAARPGFQPTYTDYPVVPYHDIQEIRIASIRANNHVAVNHTIHVGHINVDGTQPTNGSNVDGWAQGADGSNINFQNTHNAEFGRYTGSATGSRNEYIDLTIFRQDDGIDGIIGDYVGGVPTTETQTSRYGYIHRSNHQNTNYLFSGRQLQVTAAAMDAWGLTV